MKTFIGRGKSVIGLDIGSYSVKLVHLLPGGKRPKLLSGLEEEFYAPEGKGPERVVEAIRKAYQRAGLKPGRGGNVITSVSGSETAVKHVEFPMLTDDELSSSVRWQAKKHLPFESEETILDYQILGKDRKSKTMSVLLAAVTKTHLAEHRQLLEKVGIEPVIIDLSPLAVMNAFLATENMVEDKAVVVLDLGANKTILNMLSPGDLFFTREIPISGHRLTTEVQHKLNITYQEAEKIKRDGESNQKLLDVLRKPLNQLVFEIRRSLTYFENRTGRKGFHKMYLAGGSARLANLGPHLHENLGVPVEDLNPLKAVVVNAEPKKQKAAAPQLTLALGLALRGLGGKGV
jgi:type IV pilus assembly protein PilM